MIRLGSLLNTLIIFNEILIKLVIVNILGSLAYK